MKSDASQEEKKNDFFFAFSKFRKKVAFRAEKRLHFISLLKVLISKKFLFLTILNSELMT